MDWFNHRRLLEPIGDIPPAEKEANYHHQHPPTRPKQLTKTLSDKPGAVHLDPRRRDRIAHHQSSNSKNPEPPKLVNVNFQAIPPEFRDHMAFIREQLAEGRAVVMVGSGFSKNAEPREDLRDQDLPSFPDLVDLRQVLDSELRSRLSDYPDHGYETPRLARVFEGLTDRAQMEQLVRESIPDDQYVPSSLHSDLLRLPWVDVYTTNYDTLLERAYPQNRYRVVTDEQYISGTKPRLIKLHGCLKSQRPLTISDEDFRQYSQNHPVFEGTIKQAMVENTLILVGFSGNDPNFQQWNDWIKHNASDHSPGIYYVGVGIDSLTAALREHESIVCLDMSTFTDIEDRDHRKALSRFFECIASATSDSSSERQPPAVPPAFEMPPPWPLHHNLPGPTTDETTVESLADLVEAWREDRRSYPGWVVAPASQRRKLWSNTREWTGYLPSLDTVPDSLALEFVFELVWRMKKSLCPIFNNQIGFFEEVLNRHIGRSDSPRPSTQWDDAMAPLPPTDLSPRLKEMCLDLSLALLRYYREEGKSTEWESKYHLINTSSTQLSPRLSACFYFERAMFALQQLNLPELEGIMEEWPSDDSMPFWEAKRAGLLAHMGRVDDAEDMLEESLQTVSDLMGSEPDLALLSQESLILVMLRYARSVSPSYLAQPEETRRWEEEFDKRWEALRQYQCNPWDEMKAFREKLDQEVSPSSHPDPSPPFDIGHVRGTRYLAQPNRHLWEAYNFLRYREDAGIPLRYSPKTVAQAAARIVATERHWAISALIQTGDSTEVDRVLNRITLAGLPTGYVDDLTKRCVTALDGLWRSETDSDGFQHVGLDNLLAKLLPEVLSRLCTRASTQAKDLLIETVVTIYRSENRMQYRGVQHWITRLLRSCSVAQRIEAIPKLLNIPTLSDLYPIEEREYIHPFLILELKKGWLKQRLEMPHGPLARVIAEADSDDPATRNWALLTVGTLHVLGLLNSEQTQYAAAALWRRIDGDDLPLHTGYYRHAFLGLPAPATVDPQSLFRAYVRRAQFPIQPEQGGVTLGASTALCQEIRGARRYFTWSTAEVKSIISRLIQWWDADKEYLNRPDRDLGFLSIPGEFRRRFSDLIRTAESIIAPPFYAGPETNTKSKLSRLLTELTEYGMPTLRLEIASLHIFPERRNEVLTRVKMGMASSSEETVRDCLHALWVLVGRTRSDGEAEAKRQLANILQEATQILYWRRQKGLPLAINTIADTLQMHPWLLEENQEAIGVGLQRLIGDTTIHPQSSAPTEQSNMDVPLKLSVRQAAAHLAHTLYNHHARADAPIPSVIMEWKSICHSDEEFAEIRNQWASAS